MFKRKTTDQFSSSLCDQDTFYRAFLHDLQNCATELIIESPFITDYRMRELLPVLTKLSKRGVRIYINTRHPDEHDPEYAQQALTAVSTLQDIDATVLYTYKHHRKLAIIDRSVIWEGSLNILSYSNSSEIMRRMHSTAMAEELLGFIKLSTYTGGTI
jgi:hypothetical protein